MNKQRWITVGVILGLIAVRFLAPVINGWIGKGVKQATTNPVNASQAHTFVADSIKLQLTFSTYRYVKVRYDKFMVDYLTLSSYIFQDSKTQRYFTFPVITNTLPSTHLFNIAKNVLITCDVSKKQYDNNAYGTLNHPIVILKCYIPPQQNWDSFDISHANYIKEVNEAVESNMLNYLTFFVPRQDYQQWFAVSK